MSTGERDWELLSAHVDGQLDSDVAERLEARLASETALKSDFEAIRDLKAALADLRPEESTAAQPEKPRALLTRKPAIAAIAAGVVFLVAAVVILVIERAGDRDWVSAAVDIHEQFSKLPYVVEERRVTRIVSSGHALAFRAPDLSASRLYLVDIQTSDWQGAETIGIHYRGLNGCRLSVVAIFGDRLPAAGRESTDTLLKTWSHGGYNFAAIAKGMDGDRFGSVAVFLEATINEDLRKNDDLRVAMASNYQRAKPCA